MASDAVQYGSSPHSTCLSKQKPNRESIPYVIAAWAERVTVQRMTGMMSGEAVAEAVPFMQTPDRSYWRFPWPSQFPEALEGEYILVAYRGESAVPRRIVLRSALTGSDYVPPSQPKLWLDMDVPTAECGLLGEVTQAAEAATFHVSVIPISGWPDARAIVIETSEDEVRRVERLTEILAALSYRRPGIDKGELYEWTRQVLGVRGRLAWDVIRAWVEIGCLDCFTNRRWRMQRYFARRPHLVAYRLGTGTQITATLQGLAPRVIRQHLERVARGAGVVVEQRQSASPWVPSLLVLRARSTKVLEEISRDAGLGQLRWLQSIDRCVTPIAQVTSIPSVPLSNHVLARRSPVRSGWYRVAIVGPGSASRQDQPEASVIPVVLPLLLKKHMNAELPMASGRISDPSL